MPLPSFKFQETPEVTVTGGHAEQRLASSDINDAPYVGPDLRIIDNRAGVLPSYEFQNPSPGRPGSVDRITPQDIGGYSGAETFNFKDGPVRGHAMDSDPTYEHQRVVNRPPGNYGPVVGGEDYSTLVANAAYQESFARYSTASSDQAIIGAI